MRAIARGGRGRRIRAASRLSCNGRDRGSAGDVSTPEAPPNESRPRRPGGRRHARDSPPRRPSDRATEAAAGSPATRGIRSLPDSPACSVRPPWHRSLPGCRRMPTGRDRFRTVVLALAKCFLTAPLSTPYLRGSGEEVLVLVGFRRTGKGQRRIRTIASASRLCPDYAPHISGAASMADSSSGTSATASARAIM